MDEDDTDNVRDVGYTTDDNGKPSMMRAMSIISMGTAVILAFILMQAILSGFSGDGILVGFYLVLSFLITATAPKALQKWVERRFPEGFKIKSSESKR